MIALSIHGVTDIRAEHRVVDTGTIPAFRVLELTFTNRDGTETNVKVYPEGDTAGEACHMIAGVLK